MQAFPARLEFPSEAASVLMTSGGPVPGGFRDVPLLKPPGSGGGGGRGRLRYGGAIHAKAE